MIIFFVFFVLCAIASGFLWQIRVQHITLLLSFKIIFYEVNEQYFFYERERERDREKTQIFGGDTEKVSVCERETETKGIGSKITN